MNAPEAQIDLHSPSKDTLSERENTFAPVINKRSEEMVRDRPVQELLYEDAMRR